MKSDTCSITFLHCALKCKKIRQFPPEQGGNRERGTLELCDFRLEDTLSFQIQVLNV
jgi:hypothetical protein